MDIAFHQQRPLAAALMLFASVILQYAAASPAVAREYHFAYEQDDGVKYTRGGALPNFTATSVLQEDVLQAVAARYGVTLTVHCEDPLADTVLRPFDAQNATLAQAVDQARGKSHTFVYRDGAGHAVDVPEGPAYATLFNMQGAKQDQQVATVDAFPPGCGTTGAVGRRFYGNNANPILDRDGPPPSLDEISAVMASDGPLSRSRAMLALRLSKDPGALALAERSVNDPNPRVMLEAGRALVVLGKKDQSEQQAAQALADRFKRDPYLDLVLLAASLDQSVAWPMIQDVAGAPDKRANSVAIRALALSLDPRGIRWLATVVRSGERSDAEQAAAVIGKTGGPTAVAALAELLATSDSVEQQSIVLSGIALLDESDRAKLDDAVARHIVSRGSSPEMDEALVRRRYLKPLEALISDPSANADAKMQALTAMATAGDETTIASMAPALKDPRPAVRLAATQSIGRLASEEAIQPLTQATTDSDPEVRAAAAKTLGIFFPDEQVVASLTTLLRDPNQDVRRNAIDSMANIGKPSEAMVEAYKTARNSSDPYVAKRAAELLKYWQVEK